MVNYYTYALMNVLLEGSNQILFDMALAVCHSLVKVVKGVSRVIQRLKGVLHP